MKRAKFIKIFVSAVVVLSMLASFALVANAEEQYNIARMAGATHHWSGTWTHQEDDCMQGDIGANCFNGNYGDKWGSADLNAEDQWLSVEFDGTRKVTGFKIFQADTPWTNNQGFDVQYQNGSDEWKTALSVTASDLGITDGSKWKEYSYTFAQTLELTAFRIYVPTAMIGAGVSAVELSELEIYSNEEPKVDPNAKVNLAQMLGVTYHWSGTWGNQEDDNAGGNPGLNCFDGRIGGDENKWGSANLKEEAQYVGVEFAWAQKVEGIRVWQANTTWTDNQGFEIQYQNGTDEWKTALTVTADDLASVDKHGTGIWSNFAKDFDTPIEATAIRVYVASEFVGSKDAVELTEFAVYGVAQFGGKGTGKNDSNYDIGTVTQLDLSGAKAYATTIGSGAAQSAIDGDINSKWGAQQGIMPQSLLINLGTAQNIAGFIINQDHYWTDVTAYTLEANVNGEWIEILSEKDIDMDEEYQKYLENIWNTSLIRFTFTAVGDGCIRGEGSQPTTSVDMKEVKILTAEPIADDTPGDDTPGDDNPDTGDNGLVFVAMIAVCAMCAATLIIKRKSEN